MSRHVEYYDKTYEIPDAGKCAKLHIWDTLGQEKFRSIAKLFFKGSAAAFVVFDLTRQSSFD